MATFTKFNTFVQALGEKKHNLATDQLTIALTNTVPVATNSILANLTQVSYTDLSSRDVTTTSFTNTSGTSNLVCADLTLTASGAVATFRYVVLYNNTASNDELIGWWDRGSTVTLASGETFLIDFVTANKVLTIA